jgi:hypothetical protein
MPVRYTQRVKSKWPAKRISTKKPQWLCCRTNRPSAAMVHQTRKCNPIFSWQDIALIRSVRTADCTAYRNEHSTATTLGNLPFSKTTISKAQTARKNPSSMSSTTGRTLSVIFSSSLCIITTHSPLLVSQMLVRLLMPWHLQKNGAHYGY